MWPFKPKMKPTEVKPFRSTDFLTDFQFLDFMLTFKINNEVSKITMNKVTIITDDLLREIIATLTNEIIATLSNDYIAVLERYMDRDSIGVFIAEQISTRFVAYAIKHNLEIM